MCDTLAGLTADFGVAERVFSFVSGQDVVQDKVSLLVTKATTADGATVARHSECLSTGLLRPTQGSTLLI